MTDNFNGKRFQLTPEHGRKGGLAKSKVKTLSCQLNPVKHPATMRRILVKETDLQVEALKNLVRLSSRDGLALLDEMIEALQKYKLLITDAPTIRNVDSYLKTLFEFKRTIWGDRLIIEEAKKQGLTFEDLVKRLPDFRREEKPEETQKADSGF